MRKALEFAPDLTISRLFVKDYENQERESNERCLNLLGLEAQSILAIYRENEGVNVSHHKIGND